MMLSNQISQKSPENPFIKCKPPQSSKYPLTEKRRYQSLPKLISCPLKSHYNTICSLLFLSLHFKKSKLIISYPTVLFMETSHSQIIEDLSKKLFISNPRNMAAATEERYKYATIMRTLIPTGKTKQQIFDALTYLWSKSIKKPEIIPSTDEIFIVDFKTPADLEEALWYGPWAAYGQILLIKKFNTKIPPQISTFEHFTIWFRFIDLPYFYWSRQEIRKLLKGVAIIERFNPQFSFPKTSDGFKVCIRVAATDPLPLGVNVENEFGGISFVLLAYDNIPTIYCSYCRRMGHEILSCCRRIADEIIQDEEAVPTIEGQEVRGTSTEENNYHTNPEVIGSGNSLSIPPGFEEANLASSFGEEREIAALREIMNSVAGKAVQTEKRNPNWVGNISPRRPGMFMGDARNNYFKSSPCFIPLIPNIQPTPPPNQNPNPSPYQNPFSIPSESQIPFEMRNLNQRRRFLSSAMERIRSFLPQITAANHMASNITTVNRSKRLSIDDSTDQGEPKRARFIAVGEGSSGVFSLNEDPQITSSDLVSLPQSLASLEVQQEVQINNMEENFFNFPDVLEGLNQGNHNLLENGVNFISVEEIIFQPINTGVPTEQPIPFTPTPSVTHLPEVTLPMVPNPHQNGVVVTRFSAVEQNATQGGGIGGRQMMPYNQNLATDGDMDYFVDNIGNDAMGAQPQPDVPQPRQENVWESDMLPNGLTL